MAAKVTTNFDGMDRFQRALIDAAHDGLEGAALTLQQAMEDELNKSAHPIGEIIGGRKQRAGGIKGGRLIAPGSHKGRTLYRGAPAGSAPGKRTGRLGNSIVYTKPKNLRTKVGTNLEYGRHLELGFSVRNTMKTPKQRRYVMALVNTYKELGIPFRHKGPAFDVGARPWARPSLSKSRKNIQKAFDHRATATLAKLAGGAV